MLQMEFGCPESFLSVDSFKISVNLSKETHVDACSSNLKLAPRSFKISGALNFL